MERQYHCWHSPPLQREMQMLVFGHAGMRVLVFPTRVGRFYDYENWGLVAALRHPIENGLLQLYCVDSVDADSFYCDWRRPADRILCHDQYESYLLDEVLPFSERLNPHSALAAHGCSFGAYHAVNIAFRHPQRFAKVVALSGRYDLTKPTGSFRDLFDGYYDERIYFHNPSHYLPNLADAALLKELRRMDITLAIGEEDAFFENNVHFHHALREKGIDHAFYVWSGEAHRPRCWRQMTALYL